jgi:hypothetical protein
MTPENRLRIVEELAAAYTSATKATEGGRTFIRLPKVHFPKGCSPSETSVLVVVDDGQPAPQLYVKQIPTLANGRTPRSTSAVQLAGESWQTFSFSQPWDENTHTAVQFVEGRLRRFALSE